MSSAEVLSGSSTDPQQIFGANDMMYFRTNPRQFYLPHTVQNYSSLLHEEVEPEPQRLCKACTTRQLQ